MGSVLDPRNSGYLPVVPPYRGCDTGERREAMEGLVEVSRCVVGAAGSAGGMGLWAMPLLTPLCHQHLVVKKITELPSSASILLYIE